MNKPLPNTPNLAFDKKQAKALLKAYRAGDVESFARIRKVHPRLLNATDATLRNYAFSLSDAQLVIARDYGFPSWAKLKAHIQSLTNSLPLEIAQFKTAITDKNLSKVRHLLETYQTVRESINDPLFSFGSVALGQVRDHRELLDLLLEYGADLNVKSNWWAGGFHLLHHTEPEIAQYLITRGAEVDIHAAAELDMLAQVEAMIEADSSLVNARGGDGKTPLHYAKTPRVMDYLLAQGADINLRDIDHQSTPLQWALNDEAKCRYLVEKGAEIDIFMACRLGDIALVERALKEYPNALDARVGSDDYPPVPRATGGHIYIYEGGANRSPHQVALAYGHSHVHAYLIEQSSLKTRFLDACERADEATARDLLNQQPDLLAQLTPQDKNLLPARAWEHDIEAVRVMLNLGFDPHFAGAEDSTPLDRASFHGFADIVELLLERDPNPPLEFKNTFGGTPLDAGIYGMTHSWRDDGDHIATIRALVAHGARIDQAWIPSGNDAVDQILREGLARQRQEIASPDDLFMQAVDAVIHGNADKLTSLLSDYPDLITMRSSSEHQATLLFYVAANGVEDDLQKTPSNALEIASILIDAGAELDATSVAYGANQTPLTLLVSSAHPAQAGVQADLAKLFVESGAQVNGIADDGLPLATALLFGYPKSAQTLVECGARVDNLIMSAGLGDVALTNDFFDEQGTLIDDALGTYVDPFRRTFDDNQAILDMAFWVAMTNDQYETGTILLSHGANIDYTPFRNETQLHWAGWYGKREKAEFLIEHGANTNIRDERYDLTPAGWAMENGHTELSNYLGQYETDKGEQ